MNFLRMCDLALRDQRLLIREDLNVPLDGQTITSTQRLDAALPTLQAALDAGAAVMVLAHLGRPTEGQWQARDSLAPVAEWLAHALGRPVPLLREYLDGVSVQPGELVLLENCRMNVGEAKDDPALAARYAALCDIFVMDAFGTAHRAQASTHGVIRAAKVACAGPLLAAELDALGRALKNPQRPLLAIVGGAKVSTKLKLLGALIERVDQLIVGGGIANTFIAAAGHPIGKSLCEPDLIEAARQLSAAAQARGAQIPIPSDVVVAREFAASASGRVCKVSDVADDEMILDIGPDTRARYAQIIAQAGTVIWNGPVGVFEFDAFAAGTETVARAIAAAPAFSIAGGGDTLAAIDKYGVTDQISYSSTGGGAFLEFVEGKTLPAVQALLDRAG